MMNYDVIEAESADGGAVRILFGEAVEPSEWTVVAECKDGGGAKIYAGAGTLTTEEDGRALVVPALFGGAPFRVWLSRTTSLAHDYDSAASDEIDDATIAAELRELRRRAEETAAELKRTLKVPETDAETFFPSAPNRAGKILSFDENGNARAVLTATDVLNAAAHLKAAIEAAQTAAAAAKTAEAARAAAQEASAEARQSAAKIPALETALTAHADAQNNPHLTSYGATLAAMKPATLLPAAWTGGEIIWSDGTEGGKSINESRYPQYFSHSRGEGTSTAEIFIGKSIMPGSVLGAALHFYDGATGDNWGIQTDANGVEVYGKPLTVPAAESDAHAVNKGQLAEEISESIAFQTSPVLCDAKIAQTHQRESGEANGNAYGAGWYGQIGLLAGMTADELAADGAAERKILPLELATFRRSSGASTNGTLGLFLRILRRNEAGNAWTVAYQAEESCTTDSVAAGEQVGPWEMVCMDGRGAIPATETVLVCAVAQTAQAADVYYSFSWRTTSAFGGAISAFPEASAANPSVYAFSPRFMFKWTETLSLEDYIRRVAAEES